MRIRQPLLLLLRLSLAGCCCHLLIQLLPSLLSSDRHHSLSPSPSLTRPRARPRPRRQLVPQLLGLFPDRCPRRQVCIAFGTRLFNSWSLWRHFVKQLDKCDVECQAVSDLSEANAVVFHARDLPNRLEWKRERGQLWIYLDMESPQATAANSAFSLNSHRFTFNWTATPHPDSTVPIVYGSWRRRRRPLPRSTRFYNPTKKRRLAFAVVSNCRTFSRRERLLKRLREHMEVDMFGACGGGRINGGLNAVHNLSAEYRFVLSFESALCRHYITEKLHENSLLSESVPVTLAGFYSNEVTRVAPPKSCISAREFNSSLMLANFLKWLANNESAYAEYFSWRREFESSSDSDTPLCRICRRLRRRVDGEGEGESWRAADLRVCCDPESNCRPQSYTYLP